MPKIAYQEINFNTSSQVVIVQANAILDEYAAQGLRLTLRQLYYQFVARGLIENKVQSYKRLGKIVADGRLAGLIDWHHLEDRTRGVTSIATWDSPSEIVDACARQFKIDMWERQAHRIEVWVEKEALAGVIEMACQDLRLPFLSCRGYTSISEMWESAQRIIGYQRNGHTPVILHLGDHDPSGIDMTRDIEDRLAMFCHRHGVKRPELRRLALNMDQVEKYNPPPNPAKESDSRFEGYRDEYGDESWELDALEPKVMTALIRDAVFEYRDVDIWKEDQREEKKHKALLQTVSDRWSEVVEFVGEVEIEEDEEEEEDDDVDE